MNFLAATDIRKYWPKNAEESGLEHGAQHECCLNWGRTLSHFVDLSVLSNDVHFIHVSFSQRTMGSRWVLQSLAGSAGVGGVDRILVIHQFE
jgi:hypothetical protein